MNDFDDAMLVRLRASKTEAARVVLDLYKGGRKMPDAIVDAVETVAWTRTAQLRRWTDNWKAFLAWMGLQAKGWEIELITKRDVQIIFRRPKVTELTREEGVKYEEAVAAGADVRAVKYANSTLAYRDYGRTLVLLARYEITRKT